MYLDIIAFNYIVTCRLKMEVETSVAFAIILVICNSSYLDDSSAL